MGNYETLKEEIEEDTNKWKHIPCSWMGRINIIKMFILLRAIYRFNTISIKIPMMYFSELQQIFQTCVWKHKKPPIATATLRKKNKVGGITRPNIKPHHKSTVIAAARYRHTADTQINGTALTPKGGNIHTCSMKSLGKEYSPPPIYLFFQTYIVTVDTCTFMLCFW